MRLEGFFCVSLIRRAELNSRVSSLMKHDRRLDRGELDKIIERSAVEEAGAVPTQRCSLEGYYEGGHSSGRGGHGVATVGVAGVLSCQISSSRILASGLAELSQRSAFRRH